MDAPHRTRREWIRDWIGAGIGATLPGWLVTAAQAGTSDASRRYRIDATVLLFGAPVLTRAGVGGAYLSHAWHGDARGGTRRLEFAAGSWPERAHGLHRMGLFQELQESVEGEPARAAFFGFMTSSPEKDVAEARRSLAKSGEEHYVAVAGTGSQGRFHCRRVELDLPPGQRWEECRVLSTGVRRRLEEPAVLASEIDAGDAQSNTFLDSVRQAMVSVSDRHEALFVHNAKRYRLSAQRRTDTAATRRFATRGLVSSSAHVARISGSIADFASGGRTAFQLWFEPGDPTGLPLCFDFQPRSFLRLVFEWDRAGAARDSVSALLQKENE